MGDSLIEPPQRNAAVLLLALFLGIAGCGSKTAPTGNPVDTSGGATAGTKPGDATLETPSPGVVIGRVIGIAGPMPKILIQLKGERLRQATTDDQGEFILSDVPPGKYLLSAIDVPTLKTGLMGIKYRGVEVPSGGVVDEEFLFGEGFRVHGSIDGLPPIADRRYLVTVRRLGGPQLTGTPLSDQSLQVEAAKFVAGSCYVSPGQDYQIPDIDPGTYDLDVSATPSPSSAPSDRWPPPLFRTQIEVGEAELEYPISIGRP